jgi:pilus assembly protein CpaB
VVGDGKRAMTVRVNDVIGVAGLRCLAITSTSLSIRRKKARSERQGPRDFKIVLERILVLAVAQEANRDETKPKVVNAVTLEVTPIQAEKLDLARSVGNLSLVLRNQVDPNPTATVGETKESLLGLADRAPQPASVKPTPKRVVIANVAPAAPTRPTDCVEVIRGGAKSTECF